MNRGMEDGQNSQMKILQFIICTLFALLSAAVIAAPSCDASKVRDLYKSYADNGRICLDIANTWGVQRAQEIRRDECRAMNREYTEILNELRRLASDGCYPTNWTNGPRSEDLKYAEWMHGEIKRLAARGW